MSVPELVAEEEEEEKAFSPPLVAEESAFRVPTRPLGEHI